MMDNREFLDRIYEKAKVLEDERSNSRKRYNKYLQFSSVAALLILIPLFAFKDQILKPNPMNINEIEPKGIKMFTMVYEEYFHEADYIVLGQKVDSSWDKTSINIEIQESFLGDISGLINLDHVEGFGSNRVLLFLKGEGKTHSLLNGDSYFTETKEGVFQDNLGHTLSIQDIEDNIRRKIK